MKTLLTIGNDTFALRKGVEGVECVELVDVLSILKEAVLVRDKTHYGADPKTQFDKDHGYFTRFVSDDRPARLSVSLVMDEDIVSECDWDSLCDEADAKAKTNLPEAA